MMLERKEAETSGATDPEKVVSAATNDLARVVWADAIADGDVANGHAAPAPATNGTPPPAGTFEEIDASDALPIIARALHDPPPADAALDTPPDAPPIVESQQIESN